MTKRKRSEITQVSNSKTVVTWKNRIPGDSMATTLLGLTGAFSTIGVLFSTMGPLGVSGLVATGVISVFFGGASLTLGRLEGVNEVVQRTTHVPLKSAMGLIDNKNKHCLESYFINHPQKFLGLVSKEQSVMEINATHEVKTYLITDFRGQRIEQEIIETQDYMWDCAMDSVETLMTESNTKSLSSN